MLTREAHAFPGVSKFYSFQLTAAQSFPLFLSPVHAGFPSPADDYLDEPLDLHQYIEANPIATFFVRAKGESMTGAGIDDGDLLVVDRSVNRRDGDIAVCFLRGEFTVKRLNMNAAGKVVQLLSENPRFAPINMEDGDELRVFGVVTYTVKKHRRK